MLVGRCSSELSGHILQGRLKKSQPPTGAQRSGGTCGFFPVLTRHDSPSQGLKPNLFLSITARLKSCPDTKQRVVITFKSPRHAFREGNGLFGGAALHSD